MQRQQQINDHKRIASFSKLLKENPKDIRLAEALLSACANATAKDDGSYETKTAEAEYAFKKGMEVYNACLFNAANARDIDNKRKWLVLTKSSLLFLAHKYFDSFMLYLEFDRRPDKRFYAPRKNQLKPIVDGFQDVADGKIDLLTVSQPKRTGKGGMPDDKILTPTGWTTYGQIKEGDKVICANGKVTTVNGVFHRGKVPMYEVEFDGGCKTHCSFDHLWTVQTEEDREHWGTKTRTMKFADMIPHFFRGNDKHSNYSVQYVKPIEFERNSKLPIKPWLLGAVIGDGTTSQNGVRFSNTEQDLLERFAKELPDGCSLVKSTANGNGHCDYRVNGTALREKLKTIGLMSRHSYDKFIPKEYLFADVESRTELLRGLVDTDGHAVRSTKNGCSNQIEYTTTSEQLAKDVEFLVRSLGGRITYKVKQGHYTKNGERVYTRKYYRMTISFASDFVPFSSEKHAKYYNVRRPVLRNYMRKYKYIGEQECICISIDDESGLYVTDDFIVTHNTTLGLMFVIWRAGMQPDKSCFLVGRGDSLAKSFYDGCLTFLQDKAEYNYWDVFPGHALSATNAEQRTIDLDSRHRFPTIMCNSIDSQITGRTEASNLLYCDDLVIGADDARNKDRLDNLWDKVRSDCLGRRKEHVPIIAQGTRFSIYDPIGHLIDIAPEMGWRTKVIEVPALDYKTDESNFYYKYGMGFSTEYYRNERKLVTDLQWESEFQQRPIEEKGVVFGKSDLQYYDKLPENVDWDAILAVIDPSEGKGDFTSMVVAFVSGVDVYIEDVVYSQALPEVNAPKCGIMCVKHRVKVCQVESNANGLLFAEKVENQINGMGGRTSVRTKRTTANKQTKIILASDNIRNHFWFKNPNYLSNASEYAHFLRDTWSYSQVSRNQHDDSVDSLAMMENMIANLTTGKVQAFKRPF